MSLECVSPERPNGASEPPNSERRVGRSLQFTVRVVDCLSVASSRLPYCTSSSELLVLVREPTASIGFHSHSLTHTHTHTHTHTYIVVVMCSLESNS